MKEKYTKKDYIESILGHCRTMCHMKCDLQDFQNLRSLIAYDLQKIGQIEAEKATKVWNTQQGKLAEKQAKKAI